jgi:penicillin-binding protein 2
MLDNRRWLISAIFILVGLIFVIKLFFIQVWDSSYQTAAADISIKKVIVYPHRGLISDRNGKLLIANATVYDIMVIPAKVKLKDTLEFCEFLGITLQEFKQNMEKAKGQVKATTQPAPFLKQLSKEDYARIQERIDEYQGFFVVSRALRGYPHNSLAHVLGYIGEISQKELEKDKTGYYRQGDYVGISGLEAAYEKELRGTRGVAHIWVDSKGREKGKYKDGKLDTISVAGQNLTSTIDLDLQQYGEKLMENKAGAIVAIEPATGEVLAMLSAPTYDPNLLAGRGHARNYGILSQDENKPLFNRTISALYPPGSTFKTVQALIALQEGYITPETVFPCDLSLVKCHGHPVGGVHTSIQHSCNPYYFSVYRRIIYQKKIIMKDSIMTVSPDGDGKKGYALWQDYLSRFNLGKKTGIDLVHEASGNVPTLNFYNRKFGAGQWKFSNIYSLGIGQGEIGVLPLQLANVCAIIANRGFYYTPHLVKSIGEKKLIRSNFLKKHSVGIDKKHFELVIGGMRDAYRMGTVAPQAVIPDLEICGKTGTAQNPRGEDHSVFIAFAPKDNPKIAIAVYVENAGFGGNVAAPVAVLMIEKYLKGKISREYLEKQILDLKLIKTNQRRNLEYTQN